jgi:uncharacterized protein YodC (DUF2158 family)
MATGTKKFAVGQIVRLKSGGPDMTVRTLPTTSENYTCQWFAGKKLEMGQFPADALEEVVKE